jgi:2-keto-4-pentenoate hydratase
MIAAPAIMEAVGLLLAARGDFRRLERFPESCAPKTIADGYAIQEAFAKAWNVPVAGYKVGCTSAESQRILGSPGPFTGRVFRPFRLDSPATISASAFHRVGIEAEFAFTLAADLPPRGQSYEREEVAGAVAALHAAIEIVDSRWTDWIGVGVPHIVADNGANGALVLGPAAREWRAFDLPEQTATLLFDGKVQASGKGAAALGNPLDALVWLANDLSARGYGLKSGDAVTTGTCTGLTFASAGMTIVADLGPVGKAELKVEP